jgi:hypothetical protein
MIKPVLFTVCAMFALSSAPAMGAPGDEVLDEITIRVLSNDNLPDSVTDIALPDIGGEHEVELPDNANEAAGQRANNAADAANNAADAAAEAADNAAEAAQDAADNAREHAADAAEKGLNQAPGQNK